MVWPIRTPAVSLDAWPPLISLSAINKDSVPDAFQSIAYESDTEMPPVIVLPVMDEEFEAQAESQFVGSVQLRLKF